MSKIFDLAVFKWPLVKLIGWLANFFPQHIFYSSKFLSHHGFSSGGVDLVGKLARALTVALSHNLKETGDQLDITMIGVTDKGRDIGCFNVVITRIEEDEITNDDELPTADDVRGILAR